MVEAGSGDERGQKKAKTMRKMIEVRKPGGGGEGERFPDLLGICDNILQYNKLSSLPL